MDVEEYRLRLQTALDASTLGFSTIVTDDRYGVLAIGVGSLYSEPAILVKSGEDWTLWAKETPASDYSMQDVKVRCDSPAGMIAIALVAREILSMYNVMLASGAAAVKHYPDIFRHYDTAFYYLDWVANNDDSKSVSTRARQTLDLTRAMLQANNDRIDSANEGSR